MFGRFTEFFLNGEVAALDKHTLHKSPLALDIQAFIPAYLTGRVDYFSQKSSSVIFDRFAECVLNSGVIALSINTPLYKLHLALDIQASTLLIRKAATIVEFPLGD